MKKAILVEYTFMTRIVIDEEKESLAEVVRLSKDAIKLKVENELSENLSEWYDDEEMPYMPKDICDFLNKDVSYFSEPHLECYFANKYRCELKNDIRDLLRNEHDNSLEIENCENELGRTLNEVERNALIEKFIFSVMDRLIFTNDVAVGYYDSLGEINK